MDFYDGTGWTNVGLGGSGFTFGSGLTNSSGTVTNDLITGKSGGQTVVGGTASGNNLTLSSTSNATKGKIIIGTASAYDQANDRIGIGTTSPAAALHINSASTSLAMKISDNSSFTARFSSDGSGNFRVAPGATSSFIIGGQGSDGGTFTNSALFNTNNGNTVLTSADLGSPLDWTDRSGNARGGFQSRLIYRRRLQLRLLIVWPLAGSRQSAVLSRKMRGSPPPMATSC